MHELLLSPFYKFAEAQFVTDLIWLGSKCGFENLKIWTSMSSSDEC